MKESIRIQRYIALLSIVLFLCKILAWFLTHSVTVLTDALESIVNVVAGFLGLYSVILAAKPRDANHPYGHGKAEFLSSAVEGTLISVAGAVIIYEAIEHLIVPHGLQRLDTGLLIVTGSGLINFFAGKFAKRQGEKHHSMVLVSAGNHLVTDAYSTIAVIIGIALLLLTKNHYLWLDSVVAMCFAVIIMITGYKVIRRSVSGIMDEMDMSMIKKVVDLLEANKTDQWIDMHNLRVINYGNVLHVDAHMTLPWYYEVKDADVETHKLEDLIRANFSNQIVEVFVHIDACMPFQCRICSMPDCKERKEPMQEKLVWDMDIVWKDSRHGKDELQFPPFVPHHHHHH